MAHLLLLGGLKVTHAWPFVVGFNFSASPSRRYKQEKHIEITKAITSERTCENFKGPILKLKDIMIMCSYANPSSDVTCQHYTQCLILREIELVTLLLYVLWVYCKIIYPF